MIVLIELLRRGGELGRETGVHQEVLLFGEACLSELILNAHVLVLEVQSEVGIWVVLEVFYSLYVLVVI